MSASAQPERILKELAGLWAGMSKGESQGVNSGVLRACAMTLVVAAKDDADVAAIGNTIAELMHEHPSRAIVLRPSSEGNIFDARVFAQCWMPFGKRQQICCEQVEITACTSRVGELPGVIVGIMVPDLPVVLWARNREWIENHDFIRILSLVRKVIVDSSDLGPNPFAVIRSLQLRVRHVGDLAWTRLTSIRETISNIFGDHGITRRFSSADSITVEHDGDPIASAYLAGWLRSGAPTATLLTPKQTGPHPRILIAGPDLDIEITIAPMLTVRIGQEEHRAMMPAPSDCTSMREELSILRPDPAHERALALAEKIYAGVAG